MAWYVMSDGQAHGPFDNAQLKSMATQGSVRPDTHVSQGPTGPWVVASNVRGLFSPITDRSASQLPSTSDTKVCPYCAEEIKAAAIKCKHCGEHLTTAPASRPAAIPDVQPPRAKAPVRVDTPERTLWEDHPAYVSYLPVWITGGLFTVFYGLGLLLIAWAYLHRNSTLYRRTTHRVLCEWGIIGRQTNEVRLSDITAISMKQPGADALLGIGNLEICTSGHSGIEVHLRGVKNPAQVREDIRRAQDEFGSAP